MNRKIISAVREPPVSTNAFAVLVDQEEEVTTSGTSSGIAIATVSPFGSSCATHTLRKLRDPFVWIDLEMTGKANNSEGILHALFWNLRLSFISGLDIEKDTIIDVACIVTDGELSTHIEVGER
jgi:hypothetical protein